MQNQTNGFTVPQNETVELIETSILNIKTEKDEPNLGLQEQWINFIDSIDDDQIERFLVPAIREGVKAFVAISESSGGSDPARSIRTRAVLKGDKYIVNGTKMWITGAAKASWGLLFARTGEQGARGSRPPKA